MAEFEPFKMGGLCIKKMAVIPKSKCNTFMKPPESELKDHVVFT